MALSGEEGSRRIVDDRSLEEILAARRQKLTEYARGYGLPLLGAIGGYFATGGIGGAASGMVLTSFGLGVMETPEDNTIRDIGYKVNLVLGASTALVKGLYLLFSK